VTRIRRIASSPLGSGALGGAVVAALCAIALAVGLIGGGDDQGALVAQASLGSPGEAPLEVHGLTVNEIYRRAAPGVAFVQAERATPSSSPLGPLPEGGGTATGSGFVIDEDGHVVTNAHVIAGADRIEVSLGEDQTPVEARLVGRDPSTDLALLEIDASEDDLHPLPLGDSSQVQVGDPVVAIGNPFGLDRTATAGIVSALQRQIEAPNGFAISDVIQTDAPINPGNSGGPLIDAQGRVIGVNSQIATGGGAGSVGVGFAVPSRTAEDVIRQLIENGEVEHAFLGITGADLDPQIAAALDLPMDQGALVQDVRPGSPADEAGIEAGRSQVSVEGRRIAAGGDLITAVDGREVSGMDDVVAAVNAKRPGEELQLELLRDGERREVTVVLADRPSQTQ
jgi:S1-C subfamily serine protease